MDIFHRVLSGYANQSHILFFTNLVFLANVITSLVYYTTLLYDRHKTAMIILHLILHSKVHIYDFHTFITSDTKQLTKRDIKRFIKWRQLYKCTINFSDFNETK